MNRSSSREVFCKKGVLEISQNSQENTCARVSFLLKLKKRKKEILTQETLTQAFSCEFCEISKNTYFHRTPLVAAFDKDYMSSKAAIFSNISSTNKHSKFFYFSWCLYF